MTDYKLDNYIQISDPDIKYSGTRNRKEHTATCRDCGIKIKGWAYRCYPCKVEHLRKYARDRDERDRKQAGKYLQK